MINSALPGSIVQAFNYYSNNEYFRLPVVKIQKVERLDPDTLEVVETVAADLVVSDPGLRYSHLERNRLSLTGARQPIRVTYLADDSLESIHNYLNNEDTKVLGADQMAKRMETISVDVTVTVRTSKTTGDVANIIASYINTLPSTQRLTKSGLMKALFDSDIVAACSALVLSATYYKFNGDRVVYTDVDEVFGATTACYLAGTLSIGQGA